MDSGVDAKRGAGRKAVVEDAGDDGAFFAGAAFSFDEGSKGEEFVKGIIALLDFGENLGG